MGPVAERAGTRGDTSTVGHRTAGERLRGGPVTDRAAARAAKTTLATRFAQDPGVAAVGLARRDAEYVVRVDLVDAGAGARVPDDVDGVRVVTHVIGTVRAL
jgi:hypothetical protein